MNVLGKYIQMVSRSIYGQPLAERMGRKTLGHDILNLQSVFVTNKLNLEGEKNRDKNTEFFTFTGRGGRAK